MSGQPAISVPIATTGNGSARPRSAATASAGGSGAPLGESRALRVTIAGAKGRGAALAVRREEDGLAVACLSVRVVQAKTDLSHLPVAKQRELERVVQIIFEEFGDVMENATGRRKMGRILKIVLFGSYARTLHDRVERGGFLKMTDSAIRLNDATYYQHRAEQELELAQHATTKEAVAAHYQLSERYLEKALSVQRHEDRQFA